MQTKLCRMALAAMLSFALVLPTAAASDMEEDAEPEEIGDMSDMTSADDWFASAEESEAIKSETEDQADKR